jgi:hypothetical protein
MRCGKMSGRLTKVSVPVLVSMCSFIISLNLLCAYVCTLCLPSISHHSCSQFIMAYCFSGENAGDFNANYKSPQNNRPLSNKMFRKIRE